MTTNLTIVKWLKLRLMLIKPKPTRLRIKTKRIKPRPMRIKHKTTPMLAKPRWIKPVQMVWGPGGPSEVDGPVFPGVAGNFPRRLNAGLGPRG